MNTLKRNNKGLIEGLEYKYNELGLIDWRKMIPKEYFVVNKQRFKENPPESIEGLEDKDLLILLNGIRWASRVRGYKSVTYPVVSSSSEHTTAVCSITWIKNFQDSEEITFSAVGDATMRNCSGFGSMYLGPIAENRAFVRCVRSSLGIEVLGYDEIQSNSPVPTKINNVVDKSRLSLQTLMQKKGYELSEILPKLQKSGHNIDNITSIETIPGPLVLKIIEILKEIK